MSDRQSLHMIVQGRVQGVGFRWFTQRVSQGLGLVGYVRNQMDGDVEVYAEGGEEELLLLRDRVGQGPGGSHISHLSECWGEAKEEVDTFEISY